MSGSVELDPDGAHLVIRFPYREDLVAEVKALPGRRWDPRGKLWRVPASGVEQVYAVFSRHLFEFAPEISSLLAGTLGAAPAKAPAAAPPTAASAASAAGTAPAPAPSAEALSISSLNQRVRDILRGQFPQTFWIVGEILDFDKQAARQHRFFTMIEKAPHEARPRARVEAALFERTAAMLQQRFADSAAEFSLRDGIEIRALVRVDLYVQSGRFQVVIEDIDPSFTLGKLALTREQILRELREQGLAERNRALAVPIPPLRVGVLASADSDGWGDFLRHLQDARVGCELTLFPIRVQGPQLKPSVLAGLLWFAERAAEFDVLCILRGGGSRTELAGFDDRELAVAVARHSLKILIGIGHHRDQSVLDVIAHSEKTPTAVAEFLVRHVEAARVAVRADAQRLLTAVSRRLAQAARRLTGCSHGLERAVGGRLQRERTFLASAARQLHGGTLLRLERSRHRLTAAVERSRHAIERRFERAHADHERKTAQLRLLDPVQVLGRGYALVKDERGRVLPAAARITAQQTLVLRLRDGSVRSRVESIELDP